jgi:hypothetical protein
MTLLTKKLSSQQGNFVFFGYPHLFLHYLLADLSMENMTSLNRCHEVPKYLNLPLYSADMEYWLRCSSIIDPRSPSSYPSSDLVTQRVRSYSNSVEAIKVHLRTILSPNICRYYPCVLIDN